MQMGLEQSRKIGNRLNGTRRFETQGAHRSKAMSVFEKRKQTGSKGTRISEKQEQTV